MAMRWLCAYNFGKIEQNLGSAEIWLCSGYVAQISGQNGENKNWLCGGCVYFFRQ